MQQQSMLPEARLEFEEVVRIDPDNLRGQMALASIYDDLGLYDEKIEKYSIVIALEKNKENADRLGSVCSCYPRPQLSAPWHHF